MFGKAPPPPHCEGLSSEQIRLVRKILDCEYNYKARAYAEKALERDWKTVFVAVAKNARYPYSEYKHTFFDRMLQSGDPALILSVLPYLNGMREGDHAALIATALRKDGLAVRQGILSMNLLPNLRAAAALRLIHDEAGNEAAWLFKLLAAPANLHYEGGVLMKRALHAERFDVADALVAQGFDLAVYADDIKAYLVENKSPHGARLWLDRHGAAAPAALPAVVALTQAEALVQDGQGYLRSGDCVSRNDQLADGGLLTTVFNFATRQQIVIAHVAGQTAAPAITPFSHIESDAALQQAAAAFVKQGGAATLVHCVTMAASSRPTLIEKPVRAIGRTAPPDSP